MKKIVGYTTGVFDLFHIGHLNLLKKAKANCDTLIVGCTIDSLVKERKNKYPVIPFEERVEILKAIRYVDEVVAQENMDKWQAWQKYKFDVMFVGDDWKETPKWKEMEKEFKKINVDIIYFPYTKSTSSTKVNEVLDTFRKV